MQIEESYYTIVKIEDEHDCDHGPCSIYSIKDSIGTGGETVEIGLYLNTPDGVPRMSILINERPTT